MIPQLRCQWHEFCAFPGLTSIALRKGFTTPRILAVAEDGTVYVTKRTPGNLVMLRDLDADGVVDVQKVVLEIKDLHGIFIDGMSIYLVDVNRIYSGTLLPDGDVGNLQMISRGIPEAGQHPNRTIATSPAHIVEIQFPQ